jgi:tight adherence protein B
LDAAILAVVPAAGVSALPRAYFARRRAAPPATGAGSVPDGLRVVIASIGAARSLQQALNTLAASGPAPLHEAFARFPMLSRMLGTVPALEVIKEELADPTSDRVIEVLVLAHERGGQIVRDILEDLVAATTRDLKLLEEIETEGLEMKINARAVLVLPWLVLVALTIREGPFREFYRSPGGLIVVLVAGVLSVAGGFLITRLARTRQEQRVFGSSATVAMRERT